MTQETKKNKFLILSIVLNVILSLVIAGLGIWCQKDSESGTDKLAEKKEKADTPSVASGRLIRSDGSYDLIATIEGAAANKQFISNLQLVNSQRAAMAAAKAKFEALAQNAPEAERAVLKKEMSDIEANLLKNIPYMAKNYGYSVDRNYLLVPMAANILKKGVGEDGKPVEDESKATIVSTIPSAEAYDGFLAIRQAYLNESTKGGNATKAKTLADRLKTEYSFDVNGNHILQITRGALYASAK